MKLSPTAVWEQRLVGYLCGAASSCWAVEHTGAANYELQTCWRGIDSTASDVTGAASNKHVRCKVTKI